MSSVRKDARWLIAQKRVKDDGLDWDAIDYADRENYLQWASETVEGLDQDVRELLAESWNKA